MQIRRGFHRIGLAGLIPLSVLAVPCFAFAAYNWLTGPTPIAVATGPDGARIEFPAYTTWTDMESELSRRHGMPVKFGYGNVPYPSNVGRDARDAAIISGGAGIAALAFGGLWYLACWALGWIIAGFRSDG